jgi:hypothetical protein
MKLSLIRGKCLPSRSSLVKTTFIPLLRKTNRPNLIQLKQMKRTLYLCRAGYEKRWPDLHLVGKRWRFSATLRLGTRGVPPPPGEGYSPNLSEILKSASRFHFFCEILFCFQIECQVLQMQNVVGGAKFDRNVTNLQ